jgi:hypothetical protein
MTAMPPRNRLLSSSRLALETFLLEEIAQIQSIRTRARCSGMAPGSTNFRDFDRNRRISHLNLYELASKRKSSSGESGDSAR